MFKQWWAVAFNWVMMYVKMAVWCLHDEGGYAPASLSASASSSASVGSI